MVFLTEARRRVVACLVPVLVMTAITPCTASVRIGTNPGLPFKFNVDASGNSYTVANMTSLTGVAGLYVTKVSSTGSIVFSDRLGYNPAANPFWFSLDSVGNSYTIASMNALNGVAGLYLTKISPSGAVVYTDRLGYNVTALPFSATLDGSGNVTIASNMTSVGSVAGLYLTKVNSSGGSVYASRIGSNPTAAPFDAWIDGTGNVYTAANMTVPSGTAGFYRTKVNATGTTVYSVRIGTNPSALPFADTLDSGSNVFTIASMTAPNGVAGLYFGKLNATGTSVYSTRMGYNPTTTPFGAYLDTVGNVYSTSSLTSTSGVSGLYVTKLNPTGGSAYSWRLGYNASTTPFGFTVDASSNLFSVANMTGLNGLSGLYFSKVNPSGTIVYNNRLGYNTASSPFDARLDSSGNAYSIASMTSPSGLPGLYVTKLNSAGTSVFVDRLGTNPSAFPFADAMDSGNNLYLVENMTGLNGVTGLYYTKLTSTGLVSYNVRMGTNPATAPFLYVVDYSGNAYTMANMTSLTGASGLFLSKLNGSGTAVYNIRIGTNPAATPFSYYVDGYGSALSVASMTNLTGVTGLFVSKVNATGATVY